MRRRRRWTASLETRIDVVNGPACTDRDWEWLVRVKLPVLRTP